MRIAILAALIAASCGEPGPFGPEGIWCEEVKDVPFMSPAQYDMLIVIDDTAGMVDYQAALATNLSRFVNVLENVEGGLPDVQIAFITTDGTADLRGGDVLVDRPHFDGSRERNYTGTLEEQFVARGSVGTDGPSPPRPFDSIAAALSRYDVWRPEAFLFTLVIAAEDDASTLSPEQTADLLKSGKPNDPNLALFGAVIDDNAPRIRAVVDLFPNRSTYTAIRSGDWSEVLMQIASSLARVIGNPCLAGNVDPVNPRCQVVDRANGIETLIPACAPGTTRPCFDLVADELQCPTDYSPSHLLLTIERDDYPPRGTHTIARCPVSCE